MSSKTIFSEVYTPPFRPELYDMAVMVGESALVISGLALAVYGLTKAIEQLRERYNERSFRRLESQNNQQSEQDLKTINQILHTTAASLEVRHDSTAHVALRIFTEQISPPSSEL